MTMVDAIAENGTWSPQQDAAIIAVKAWLKNPNRPQIFRLFGYAGTGKTTLAKALAGEVKKVVFATFTGKAALVLRKKGCFGASTIHSLIYRAEQCEETGEITFKMNWDSELADADLLVIDEVSMVGEDLASDLIKFKKPILVLGDPAQLPPVNGEGFFIATKPDIMLTEVHRQARDNPIIRMSMDIRAGDRLEYGQWGDSLVTRRTDIDRDELGERVIAADQVLCGMNRTRTAFNARIREMRGLVGGYGRNWYPVHGDKLICLKNDREKALFNGSMWDAVKVGAKKGALYLHISSLDDERPDIKVRVFEEFFNGTESELDWKERKKSKEFTFGWAITCHKSQGSQWDNVLIFDESHVFREAQKNWLYTAVTRAAERLTLIV